MNTVKEAFRVLRRFVRAEVGQNAISGFWFWGVPGDFRDSLELTPNFREDLFEDLPEVVRNAHAVWANAVWRHREQQGETEMVPRGGSLEDLIGKREGDFPWKYKE